MKKILYFLGAVLSASILSLLLFAGQSQAIGQITSPILITGALPSESYEEELTVIGAGNTAVEINLAAEGDISGWTSFYSNSGSEQAITSILLKAGETAKVIAKFDIPANASRGEYSGTISVIRSGGEGTSVGSAASVMQKIERAVKITVDTEEKINFGVSVIPETYDLSVGQPLKIRIVYDNQGNTAIAPDIYFRLQDGDKAEYEAIFPYPENTPDVKPDAQYEIKSLEIPTAGLAQARYIAVLDFYVGDSPALHKEFHFNLRQGSPETWFISFIDQMHNQLQKRWPLYLLAILVILLAATMAVVNEKKQRRRNNGKKYRLSRQPIRSQNSRR